MTTDISLESPRDKAHEGVKLLAKHAIMLEQVGENLKKILPSISYSKSKALGYQVKSDAGYGYALYHDDEKQVTRDHTSHAVITGHDALHAKMREYADNEIKLTQAALSQIGEMVHLVQLDHRELTRDEQYLLNNMPRALESAARLMDEYVKSTTVTPENKAQVIQAKRDSTYLRKLAGELGEAHEHVITHNSGMVDREAELLTQGDIDKARGTRFHTGAKLLGESHKLAEESNPSYRERLSRRVSLPAEPFEGPDAKAKYDAAMEDVKKSMAEKFGKKAEGPPKLG